MNTKWVLPRISSMDTDMKRQILANDLVRRLSRVDPTRLQELAVPVVNFYNRKLIYSGYNLDERLRIIESGITTYEDKLQASVKNGLGFYRTEGETLATRSRKALLEKVSWYKGKAWNNFLKGKPLEEPVEPGQMEQRKESDPGSRQEGGEVRDRPVTKRRQHGGAPTTTATDDNRRHNGNGLDVLSVMFVQRTEGGALVNCLRKEEAVISERAGYRVKLVERAGAKLTELLVRSDPFGGQPCGREDCMPCLSKPATNKMIPCWRTNLTY